MERVKQISSHLFVDTQNTLGFQLLKSQSINHYFDHTALKPGTTEKEIKVLCSEAIKYNFPTVCVPSIHVALALSKVFATETKVCSVIGFPLGSIPTSCKVLETQKAVRDGAEEIDMVLCIDRLREIGRAVQQECRDRSRMPSSA
eukprot:TRINITY_DN32936_c0_g1_i2.p1 TRINITY_DN32936_c0_g1~~TRINITY_DN32936_c0_g1_i2.p1  ORF type:complete len:145 (-),score=17.21 TRINITY_DN32936_c0_g1_i2:10-444(-)